MCKELDEVKKIMNEIFDILWKEEVFCCKFNVIIFEFWGNIWVYMCMCLLFKDEDDLVKVEFLDVDFFEGGKEMVVYVLIVVSVIGKECNEKYNYLFDCIFVFGIFNDIVFDECRDLI